MTTKKADHEGNLITAYKCTRSDGTDFRTGTMLYEAGSTMAGDTV